MTTQAKIIVGFINTTIKQHKNVFTKEVSEKRGFAIIKAIIGDMEVHDPVTKEVRQYLKDNYNFEM